MDRIRQMEVFIQVMESGNFTRAADALGLALRMAHPRRNSMAQACSRDRGQTGEISQDACNGFARGVTQYLQGAAHQGARLSVDGPPDHSTKYAVLIACASQPLMRQSLLVTAAPALGEVGGRLRA